MRTHATNGARSSQTRGRRTRMQRRRSRREDGRHKLRFPPDGNEGLSAVLHHRHREPTRRQEPAVRRDKAEAVVRNRVTVPDLEGAAIMVPMGNRPPGKSLDPVARPVQAQAQKSIQAETETVLVIRQDVNDLGLRLSIEHYDSAEFAKRQIDRGPAQIVEAKRRGRNGRLHRRSDQMSIVLRGPRWSVVPPAQGAHVGADAGRDAHGHKKRNDQSILSHVAALHESLWTRAPVSVRSSHERGRWFATPVLGGCAVGTSSRIAVSQALSIQRALYYVPSLDPRLSATEPIAGP